MPKLPLNLRQVALFYLLNTKLPVKKNNGTWGKIEGNLGICNFYLIVILF
jgi:hypothetical protein